MQIHLATLAEIETRREQVAEEIEKVRGDLNAAARRRSGQFATQAERVYYREKGEQYSKAHQELQSELLLLSAAAERIHQIAKLTDEQIDAEIEKITGEAQDLFLHSHRAHLAEAHQAAIRLLTTLTPLHRERWSRTETGRAVQEAFPNANIK